MGVSLQSKSHVTPSGREYVIQRDSTGRWRSATADEESPWYFTREEAVAWVEALDGNLESQ